MKGKKNSIGLNVLHMFYSTALSSVLNAIALIVLANYLNSKDYGILSVALAFAMIMSYFTDSGLSEIVLREGSRKNSNIEVILSSYIKLRTILLVVTFGIGFIIIHLTTQSSELINMAYYLIIPMVLGVAMQSIGTTYFKLSEKMQYSGYIKMCSSSCLIIIILIGILLNLNSLLIAFMYGFAYFLAGLFSVFLILKEIKVSLSSPFHKELFSQFWSFLLSGLLFVTLPQIGPLVLEKTLTLSEVGFFAVAYRIPQALTQLPLVIAAAFIPVLFRQFNSNQMIKHRDLNILQIKVMGIIGMGMAIPFYYMSDTIIGIILGEDWVMAATLLKVLSLMLVFQSMSIALADGLTSMGKQNNRTVVQAMALLCGIILYFYLSNRIGIIGASYSGVLIEVIALGGFWLLNPHKWEIAKRALLPYMLYFGSSIFLLNYLLNRYPLISVVIHFILLMLLLLIDKELNRNLQEKLKRVEQVYKKKHVRTSKEVGGGL
ncbi:oligosaccharide flippase family protein [Guptibacillus hwajinpoensis]|uniref:oligosaccharide flippase family protein n=1 Tax=Guptibacillus hwajinpoensis TaxID=208199 RepID=UPI001CD2EAC9|nr:oligosaccharide flippase family protein [Pseudalkalibacillus hwajinpoensis]MCA0991437.1 oligosaccharide flippase family protein [Pseudalkalibacillus hwajinpoensis]